MKISVLFLLAFFCALAGKSQTFEWVRTAQINYEFNPGMIQYSSCSDTEGNIYFFGMQEHLIFYNQAMGNQFLRKYNPQGELIWEKIITGEGLASGIYSDPNDGIYLFGQLHSDLFFWDELTLYYEGITTNSFLIKINTMGEADWGINMEDLPVESGTISDLVATTSGNLYVAYSTWIRSYILKMNTDADYLGSVIQENVSLISGIDADNSGNIFAAGSCAGVGSMFNGVSYPAPFPYSMYIVKYNADFEPEWVKFIEDITCTTLKITCDNNGGLYAAGQIFTETLLDTIQVQGASWVYDFFLTRINQEGQFQWALECPEVLTGDATVGQLHFLSSDAEGNALLGGFTRGIIDWGGGIISNSGNLYYNIILWNVHPEGSINWIKTAGGEGYDDVHSIHSTTEGDVCVAGVAGGTSLFDTITIVTDDFVYPFLAKIDIPVMTDITDTDKPEPIVLKPNPATEEIFICREDAKWFTITSSRGEIITTGQISSDNHLIDIHDLASGIYFLAIYSNDGFRTSKFIVH